MKLHHHLEVLEHRIQTGDDPVHEHPVMAISMLRTNRSPAFSPDELVMKRRYRIVDEPHVVPAFWPTRSWDDPEDVMGDDSSVGLANELRRLKGESPIPPQEGRRIPDDEPGRPKGVRVQRPRSSSRGFALSSLDSLPMEVAIPSQAYDTDNSEDATDGDCF
jgi:hypothetical protein